NEMEVVLFLNQAEHAVEEVYYAALDNPNGRTVYEDGLAYRELPRRFDSKEKIVRFFPVTGQNRWRKPYTITFPPRQSMKKYTSPS
ncbi:hypothetical protein ABTK82_20030, partial [Acinetobacter baumannii]